MTLGRLKMLLPQALQVPPALRPPQPRLLAPPLGFERATRPQIPLAAMLRSLQTAADLLAPLPEQRGLPTCLTEFQTSSLWF